MTGVDLLPAIAEKVWSNNGCLVRRMRAPDPDATVVAVHYQAIQLKCLTEIKGGAIASLLYPRSRTLLHRVLS